MIINTNSPAQSAAHNLQISQTQIGKSIARLSTGSRITSATDDAAGQAVANSLDAQIHRVIAARNNVSSAISFTQTQDGYLKTVSKALDRMSELAILAQDVTKSDADRALYDKEFQQLGGYITSLATKEFHGVLLFRPVTDTIKVTIDSEGTTFDMNGIDLSATAYTDAIASTVATTTDAATALANVKLAMDQLGSDRAAVGSYQVRFDYTAEQLSVTKENLSAASSRIQDVDMAEESTEFARQNILMQSATSMLAQANQIPQVVLKLLQ